MVEHVLPEMKADVYLPRQPVHCWRITVRPIPCSQHSAARTQAHHTCGASRTLRGCGQANEPLVNYARLMVVLTYVAPWKFTPVDAPYSANCAE